MVRHRFSITGVLGLAAAALLLAAGPGWARHGGGGHRGGGHVGVGPSGGSHYYGRGGYHGYYPYPPGYYPSRDGYDLGFYPYSQNWPSYSYPDGYPSGPSYCPGPESHGAFPDTSPCAGPEGAYPSFYPPPSAFGPSEPDPSSLRLTVRVPAGADVWINGTKTPQTGPEREFLSPPLAAGRDYAYDVLARWVTGAGETTTIRKITFHAGERRTLDLQGTTLPE